MKVHCLEWRMFLIELIRLIGAREGLCGSSALFQKNDNGLTGQHAPAGAANNTQTITSARHPHVTATRNRRQHYVSTDYQIPWRSPGIWRRLVDCGSVWTASLTESGQDLHFWRWSRRSDVPAFDVHWQKMHFFLLSYSGEILRHNLRLRFPATWHSYLSKVNENLVNLNSICKSEYSFGHLYDACFDCMIDWSKLKKESLE